MPVEDWRYIEVNEKLQTWKNKYIQENKKNESKSKTDNQAPLTSLTSINHLWDIMGNILMTEMWYDRDKRMG